MVEKMKNEIRDRRNIFWFLAVGTIISAGLYVYFVGNTVYSVVSRQKTEKVLSGMQNEVEKLETNYLGLKASVTADLARAKGFTDISTAIYISRKALGKGLSLNNEI